MNCSRCGLQNYRDVRTCGRCGMPLHQMSQPSANFTQYNTGTAATPVRPFLPHPSPVPPNRQMNILIDVVLVVVLLIGGGMLMLGLLIGWYVFFVSTPDNLSSKICSDLKKADYASEWQSFTPNEQMRNGSFENTFVENGQFENQLTHGVIFCTTSSAIRDGDSASSQITIIYGGGEREVDILYMVDDRGTWMVDSIRQVAFYQ